MKKTLLLFGFVCVISIQTMTFAELPASRHGAICVLDDDDDEMSMEELRALEQLPQKKQSTMQRLVGTHAVTLLGWYMRYKRFVRVLARRIPKHVRITKRVSV